METRYPKAKYVREDSAFTLVELIVVIVILAILATIAFLSFSSQSAGARDSTRLSDMSNIAK
jgi:prepilin-type N-terminal cleavage/methylation domain-containing protein